VSRAGWTAALCRASTIALPLVAGAAALMATLSSCATSIDVGHQEDDAGIVEAGPVLVPAKVTDGGDAALDSAALLFCTARECPWPWATCVGTDGTLPAYACSTNLSDNIFNCGGCNVQCPHGNPSYNLTPSCVDGKCAFDCSPGAVDCNGIADDGCEIHPIADPNNCGACGNKCAAGVECINGMCGCPAGMTDCAGKCVDLTSDDNSCGQCDFACRDHPAGDASAVPPHMIYGCKQGQCTDLHCYKDVGQDWTDCNNSIQPDGCEINLGQSDPANCGTCGNTCATGEKCFARASTGMACQCRDGTTYCPGSFRGPPEMCADTENDPNNCGSCGYKCPFVRNANPTCTHGRCTFDCNEGWADCNGTSADGCEALVTEDPHNCGGCGKACAVGQGQPCVDGECAMVACDAGGPR
jgi:hypothetical protein